MKNRSCNFKIAVILAAILVSVWSAAAEDTNINMNVTLNMGLDNPARVNTNGIYLSGDAGLAIMQNMTANGNLIEYHVGPKFDVSAGYNLPRNIAVELQAGFAYNGWSAFNESSTGEGLSAYVWTVPVMANGIYKYSFADSWQVYGGLGVGAVVSTLHFNEIGPKININSSSTDCQFGYQAMVGLRYIFDDHLEWGVGYTFLGSLNHNLNVPNVSHTTSPTYMHSVLASLTYRF